MKKILYAAAECAPFIKTGGLGTVVGAVPGELCRQGLDVRVILPAYECIDRKWKDQMVKIMDYPVRIGWRVQTATLYELDYHGVRHYLVGNSFYFSGDRPYADPWLDIEKFSFFARAVLEMLSYQDYLPDVIHCHDWHTGLLPVYLRTEYDRDPFYKKIRTVMTIHNLKFQGVTDMDHMKDVTGLPDQLFTYDKLEFHGRGNVLKGGLVFADKITTVSSTYAAEILQPEYGEGLSDLLQYRKDDVSGIVNGIDTGIYNPASDPAIRTRYDISNFRKGKKENKRALQEKTGLPEDSSVFTIAIISRLTEQKGFDLLIPILAGLLSEKVQLYVLGGGEARYEGVFSAARAAYPDSLYTQFDYEDSMAKLMYAGCDAVLMPSLFEPCGLNQLMAFRYGTVPVVRLTGGLVDTVKAYQEKKSTSTGFGFTEYSAKALSACLQEAMDLYYGKRRAWDAIARRCMQEDYSWDKQAQEYLRLYESIRDRLL
ncbi:MAG: glycogen synthase [Eubacterium sp.]|nr:glycogen synthase [Eubacterium sp.]